MAEIHAKRAWGQGNNRTAGGGPNPPYRSYGDSVAARAADETIERLAWLMDGSIKLPGGYSIGLDPIIGLVPGIGDLIGTLVSSAIVLQAQRAGIPKATLIRMVTNVGIDTVVGAVPFFGDVFDFAFKANAKNLELYRSARAGARDANRDAGFVIIVFLALGLIVALPILAIIWMLQAVF